MTIPLPELARAYAALFPGRSESFPFPPTEQSIHRINEALSIRLPDSLIWFAANTGACQGWLASLGEDYESGTHILHMASRTRKIRRRVMGGRGRWEFVRPAAFVPFNLGFDADYNCLDGSTFDPATGEYAIQYWSPPRIFGAERYSSFPQYMEACIRSWAEHARAPVKEAVLAIIGAG